MAKDLTGTEELGEIELAINLESGLTQALYSDTLSDSLQTIGGRMTSVDRLSNVEWDEGLMGWVVRAVHDRKVVILESSGGYSVGRAEDGVLAVFRRRADAIFAEVSLWAYLLPPTGEAP